MVFITLFKPHVKNQSLFYIDDLHYNLLVKILNDKFGIQTLDGCTCAGTYES